LFSTLAACSSLDHKRDAGGDDGVDGTGDAQEDAADTDTDEDFGLLIPAGTRMCTMFGTTDMLEEHLRKGRLTPRPGLIRLFREQDEFEDDWIDRLELAPDGAEATPVSAGTFQREIVGTELDGTYRYDFHQAFELDGRTYQVTLMAAVEVEAGTARNPLITLDEYALSNGDGSFDTFRVQGAFGEDSWPRTYFTCRFELFQRGIMDLTVDNGDRVILDLRIMDCPPDMFCAGGTAKGATVMASFTRNAENREVDDFFRLAFSHKHHGIFDYSYFVWFDEPIDLVHGLWIPEPETSIAPIQVQYLDADKGILEVGLVTERNYTEL
jgi:hypothetical protein